MGCLAFLPAARAADEPVDPGLLEFLGSVDTEDKNWHRYLAHTDIERVAKRSGDLRPNSAPPTPASPPAGATPPPKDPPPNVPTNAPAPVTPP
jgi:hypothetical protein